MELSFTIRWAQPQDRVGLVGLMGLLQEVERRLYPSRPRGAAIAEAHFSYLEAVVREQDGRIYVAAGAGEILGFLVCFVEGYEAGDSHIAEGERQYGYISDLYVVPEMRKGGVGAALMGAAEEYFLGLNLKIIRVGLLANNQAAARFYGQIGYQPYEVIYEKRMDF